MAQGASSDCTRVRSAMPSSSECSSPTNENNDTNCGIALRVRQIMSRGFSSAYQSLEIDWNMCGWNFFIGQAPISCSFFSGNRSFKLLLKSC